MDLVKKLLCYSRRVKKTFLQVFPACSQTSDISRNVLRKFAEPSMEPPCWWSSLLELTWLSMRLIIWTEPKTFTQEPFLTLELLKRLQISREEYIFLQIRSERYVTHCHNSELQTALVSRPNMLLSWKNDNRDPLMPDED